MVTPRPTDDPAEQGDAHVPDAARGGPGGSAVRLALAVGAGVLLLRLAANLWLAATHGAYASPNPEIWFYLGVAEGVDPAVYHLSAWDPTRWLLGGLGLLLDDRPLYVAVLVAGSVAMALASAFLALAARAIAGSRVAGVAAGGLYAVMPWTYGASLGGFTHDTIGLPLAATAIWLWTLVGGPAGRRTWLGAAGLLLAILVGLRIGPTALAILLVTVLLALVWLARPMLGTRRAGLWIGGLAVAAALALLAMTLFEPDPQRTWVGWIWQRLAAAAESQRGLDIALQSRQGSADVLPGRPIGLIVPYSAALLVAALAGAVFAWRRGHLEPALLLAVGALGFCIGQRGIRIVDLGVALAAGVALGDAGGHRWLALRCPGPRFTIGGGGRHPAPSRSRQRGRERAGRRDARATGGRPRAASSGAVERLSWCGALAVAALALVALLLRPAAGWAMIAAGLCLVVALAVTGLQRPRAWGAAAVCAACLLLAIGGQSGIESVLAVGDAHVEILRQVRASEPVALDEQILPASWDLGYIVGMVSGRRPAAHPQAINAAADDDGENDARIFWSPESAAAAEAARRNIRFIYIGDRDFAILDESVEEDRFRARRRLGVQMPTLTAGGERGPMPLSIVRQLLIYRMLKEPERLRAWRLFAESTDARSGERLRVFELVEPPEPGRTYVYAIFDNPAPVMQETGVQLFHDGRDGAPDRKGARLRSQLRPWHSSLSIFSFIGVEQGRARAELDNPAIELRLLARQAGGHYHVDFVRPRRGWRPLQSR